MRRRSGLGYATAMPARRMNRRKLTFQDREFLWYVRKDPDSAGKVLHVLSHDKRFVVMYEFASGPRFVVVVGREFPGLPTTGGSHTRLRCPPWEDDATINERFVLRLVEWCFDTNKTLVPV